MKLKMLLRKFWEKILRLLKFLIYQKKTQKAQHLSLLNYRPNTKLETLLRENLDISKKISRTFIYILQGQRNKESINEMKRDKNIQMMMVVTLILATQRNRNVRIERRKRRELNLLANLDSSESD